MDFQAGQAYEVGFPKGENMTEFVRVVLVRRALIPGAWIARGQFGEMRGVTEHMLNTGTRLYDKPVYGYEEFVVSPRKMHAGQPELYDVLGVIRDSEGSPQYELIGAHTDMDVATRIVTRLRSMAPQSVS